MTLLLLGGGKGNTAGGGGSPSLPSLTGHIGWWDASVTASLTLTGGGTTISAIADQSGAGNNMVSTGGGDPGYSATGFNTSYPAMVFTASNHYGFVKTSFPIGTGDTLTTWYVGRMHDGTTTTGRVISYTASGATQDFNNAGSFCLNANGFSNNQLSFTRSSAAVGPLTSTAANHRVITTVASGGAVVIYVDGVSAATGTIGGNWVSAGSLCIATTAVSNAYWGGPVAEVGICTGFHNSTVVGDLDTYLKTKWGL